MSESADITEQRQSNLERAGVTVRTWRDYARAAFHNIYNYTIIGGAIAASAMTGDFWPVLAVAGGEILWMLYAPDHPLFRRSVDSKLNATAQAEQQRERALRISSLSKKTQEAAWRLWNKKAEIDRLATSNQSLSGEMLQGELNKLERLVDSYIELCIAEQRNRIYLQSEDVNQIAKLREEYETQLKGPAGPGSELARKNLSVVQRRLERLGDIKAFLERADQQLELIENTFGLLSDQIVSMRSMQELSTQLDDLMDGVEAIRETARETEALLSPSNSIPSLQKVGN